MSHPTSEIDISTSDRAFWQEQFTRFRANHPAHQLERDGCTWTYLVAGQGAQSVVLLHSAAAGAESLFCQISLLENEYRVIAPTIPGEVATMQAACKGLAAVLDREQIPAAHIAGHSVGGMLAQCFLWLYPERAQSVALSHTVLPTPRHAEGLAQAQAEYGSLAETDILAAAAQLVRERHAHQPKPLDPTNWTANWVALEELYRTGAVRKTQILGWFRLEEDYHRHYKAPQKKPGWSRPVLIIESDADEVYNSSEREALKEAYPAAQVHTFQGWGHLGILATGPVIQAFLESQNKRKEANERISKPFQSRD